MIKLVCGWLCFVALACASDGGSGPDPGAFGSECTTVVDTGSTECESGVCTDSFDMVGHPVCSVTCTPGDDSTCPDGSAGKKCNMKGYCKP